MKSLLMTGLLLAGILFSAFTPQPMDNRCAVSTSLEVADGSLYERAMQAAPARVAARVDEAELTYGEWKFVAETSWNEQQWEGVFKGQLGDTGENRFSVYTRQCVENSNLVQIKLSKVFNGIDFIIDGDMSTNVCTSGRFKSGYSTAGQEGATLDFFDIGILDAGYLGESTFSLVGGSILIRGLAFYYREDSDLPFLYLGSVTINFGAQPVIDYDVNVKPVYGKDEKQAKITLTRRGDVKQFKYILEYNNPYVDYNEYLANKPEEIKTATDEIVVDLRAGYYNLVIRPCSEYGEWLGQESDDMYVWDNRNYIFYSNADDDAEWVEYGQCMIRESLLAARMGAMSIRLPENPYADHPCKMLTRKDAYGKIFRVVNPFGPGHPLYETAVASPNVRFDYPDEDFFLDINAEDPEHVYVYYRPMGPVTKTGLSYSPWDALGTMESLNYYQIMNGTPVEDIYDFGVYRWNRIEFKYGGLQIEMNSKLTLIDKKADEDVCFRVKGTDDVASVKYVFGYPQPGMVVADNIVNDNIESYTADRVASDDGGNYFKINIPRGIRLSDRRLIAVAFDADGNSLNSYLDEYVVDAWHPVGDASITGIGGFLKRQAPVERWGWSGNYRLVNPGSLDGSGQYFYIDANDKANVNFAGDENTGYFSTGYFMDGQSTDNPCLMNSYGAQNEAVDGLIGDCG